MGRRAFNQNFPGQTAWRLKSRLDFVPETIHAERLFASTFPEAFKPEHLHL